MSLPGDRSTSSRLMQSADCLVSILYRQVQDWWCYRFMQWTIKLHADDTCRFCGIINMGRYCCPACTEGTGLLEVTWRCCHSVRQLNSLEVTQYMQVYIKNMSKRSCEWPFSITPKYEQPHAIFGRFISIPGGWVLLCKNNIVVEDSPHIPI